MEPNVLGAIEDQCRRRRNNPLRHARSPHSQWLATRSVVLTCAVAPPSAMELAGEIARLYPTPSVPAPSSLHTPNLRGAANAAPETRKNWRHIEPWHQSGKPLAIAGWIKRIARKLQQYRLAQRPTSGRPCQPTQCAVEKSTPGQDRTGDLQRVRLTS